MDLISRLQGAFPFSRREVDLLINTAPRRYKIHYIEKRNGRGKRLIAQPTAELKLVQKWLITNLLHDLPVHHSAMAYKTGTGIKSHAQIHASNHYLLKLDFENFFPSIQGEDFYKHVSHYKNLDEEEKKIITRLLFRSDVASGKLVLSIGAPSSPFISNTVMYPFDVIVMETCHKMGIEYSRYADDLAFSTNKPHILEELRKSILQTCKNIDYPRLKINEKKTVFTSKKYQRQLTGLILSNDGTVSLGRNKKREIRAMAHSFLHNKLDQEQIGKLRGLISYSYSIDQEFVSSIKKMLGDFAFSKLVYGNDSTA